MRLNSLARFRRNKKLRKVLAVLLAITVGFIVAAEGRFAFMRIGNIRVVPPQALPQYAVWGTLSPMQEYFWPDFWFSKGDYEGLLEAYYPVNVHTEIEGWGRFKLEAQPLVPIYKVYWGGKFWYLSEDGKLWSSSLPENKILAEHRAESLPTLAWGADRATPIDISSASGNVFISSLPVNKIKGWYDMAEKLEWTKNVKFIQAGMREGSPVVRIIFYTAGGANGAQLVLPDDPKRWYETGSAVKKLYGGISNLPADLMIDCTYRGKILIRNLKKDAGQMMPEDGKNKKK